MALILLIFMSTYDATAADDIKIEDDSKIFSSTGQFKLNPYRTRRPEFSQMFSFSYSNFVPINYKVTGINQSFEEFYSAADIPLLSLLVSLKWNSFIGSLSLDLGAGFYFNKAEDGSSMTIFPGTLGVTWSWDNLFKEPYVVPYLSAGGKYFYFMEKFTAGNAQHNPLGMSIRDVPPNQDGYIGDITHVYYSGGVWIQLDWLDADGDMSSYFDRGIENTYISIGVTKLQPGADKDYGFDGEISVNAALRLEI